MNSRPEILIIKHGALGDIVLASGHIKAIRQHHPNARITCLTSKAYAPLFSNCPWIDEVWIDPKPRPLALLSIFALRKMLRVRHFDWIYDLQTSTRSTSYQRFFVKPYRWSGIGKSASHPQTGEERHRMHTVSRLNDQLRIAGITTDGAPDITWLRAHITPPAPPYALLVPGGSAHRPEKRWPVAYYITLAQKLSDRGVTPVLIGTNAEAEVLGQIAGAAPTSLNLCGKTSIAELAELARHAQWAVGNDTGPLHVIAAAGCPSTAIFSHASDPAKSAPVGAHVKVLRESDLQALTPDSVWATKPPAA